MSQYTSDEIAKRKTVIRSIVQGAFAIKGQCLSEERIEELLPHWVTALAGVPTQELPELYEIGLRHKCTTAETFEEVWKMKMLAEADRKAMMKNVVKPEDKPAAPGVPDWVREEIASR